MTWAGIGFARDQALTHRLWPAAVSLLSPQWKPAAGQICGLYWNDGYNPPAPEQFVDRARIQDAFAREGVDSSGFVVFALSYDSTGTGSPRVLESTLPEGVRPAVEAAIPARLPPPLEPEFSGWSALLRVDGGTPPRVRLGPSEECRPVLVNRAEIQRILQRSASRLGANGWAGETMNTVFEVFVDSTGAVTEKKARRISSRMDVDRAAAEAVDSMRFLPALWNRQPVSVWIQIPVSINFPESRFDTARVPAPRW